MLDNKIFARYAEAKARAMEWRSLLEDAYLFSQPHRYTFGVITPGQREEARVFDTTMVKAVITFASKMQSLLTPAGVWWVKLISGKDIPENLQHDINKKLEAATKRIFEYIHASNFDLAVNESYFDLAVGTAAVTCVEGDDENPLIFTVVPIETFYPEEGPFGTIETVWRDFNRIPIRNIKFMWPGAKLTAAMEEAVRGDITAVTELIEGTIFDEKTKMYKFMLLTSGSRDILLEEESSSSRWIVYRWSKRSTEVLGRGPVINALPSMLSLNELARFEFKSGALKVAPPLMAFNDGVLNPFNVKVEPNTIISVNQTGSGGWPLQPLQFDSNVNFSLELRENLMSQVNSLMFADPLGPINSPAKTATEISIRNQALIEEIGPAFGRLQVEFLPKIIDRVVFILKKKGLFPDIKIDGKQVALSYESPINRREEEAELSRFTRYLEVMQAAVGPELALGGVNAAQLSEWVGEKLGVDPILIKDAAQVQDTIDQAQAQAQGEQPEEEEGNPEEGDLV